MPPGCCAHVLRGYAQAFKKVWVFEGSTMPGLLTLSIRYLIFSLFGLNFYEDTDKHTRPILGKLWMLLLINV
jgi:hypothetical protein